MFILKRTFVFVGLLVLMSTCFSIEVYNSDNTSTIITLDVLRQAKLEIFRTIRHKDGRDITDNWEGINLANWLRNNSYNSFQSIRFESNDNYMVRIHKAELDTMQGFIALKRENKLLDSTEVRIVFPSQRDMLWVRGLARIYLENFKSAPPPAQIFIWDAAKNRLSLIKDPEPFVKISGYRIESIMQKIFHTEEGSVILVCRDGMKSRLEYPRHLKDAVFEATDDGTLNVKSPIIPAGMWLKDIIYMQCGAFALLKQDYLPMLPSLYKSLEWTNLKSSEMVVRMTPHWETVKIESLLQPDSPPFNAEEWIELPQNLNAGN
jgi:hypothetical protein